MSFIASTNDKSDFSCVAILVLLSDNTIQFLILTTLTIPNYNLVKSGSRVASVRIRDLMVKSVTKKHQTTVLQFSIAALIEFELEFEVFSSAKLAHFKTFQNVIKRFKFATFNLSIQHVLYTSIANLITAGTSQLTSQTCHV